MKQVVIYLAAIALLIARYVRTTERGGHHHHHRSLNENVSP
jgi:hypothetical protein